MFDIFVHFDKTTKNVCVRVIFFSFFNIFNQTCKKISLCLKFTLQKYFGLFPERIFVIHFLIIFTRTYVKQSCVNKI